MLTRRPISWEQHDPGVWVGRAGGAEVALIETLDVLYVPSILDDGALGVWHSLADAQKSVELSSTLGS